MLFKDLLPSPTKPLLADELTELAVQFEATHLAQIRRHHQSITPGPGDDIPGQLHLSGKLSSGSFFGSTRRRETCCRDLQALATLRGIQTR
jgi:hypothetical protein